jgi:oligopeptide transport system ATP-binding protein
MQNELLKVQNLRKEFPIMGGIFSHQVASVKAVQDVSFSVREGETFGLVGESGCGKSTLGRCIVRLLEATSGQIFFRGQDISSLKSGELQALRRKIQIIFQDPFSSLNPRMTIRQIIEEPLIIHRLASSDQERRKRCEEILQTVGLRPEVLDRFPHEFSGGQRQRIGIARALAVEPELIICDEPVSALDVAIQAQVINLLLDLQKRLKLTYIFIAHDLRVIEHVSDRIGVMYLGKMVEIGSPKQLYHSPKHPYTKALISAIPDADPELRKERVVLQGDVPSPINPPQGCHFNPRCPIAEPECRVEPPPLAKVGPDHFAACFKSAQV